MSGRVDYKGFKGRQNEEKHHRKFVGTPGKSSWPKNCSSLLYDNNEFPPLSEGLNNPDSDVKTLKYSDKLKLSSQNQNPNHKSFSPKDSQPKIFSDSKTIKYSSPNETNCSQTKVINDKRHDLNSVDVQNQQSYASRTKSIQSSCINPIFKERDIKIHSTKQTDLIKSSSSPNLDTVSNKAPSLSSNISCKSNIERQCNKEIRCRLILDKSVLKNEEEKDDAQGKAKKKKKRKSKIKRQAAMQTGKITVLTPEVHSKILNQPSALNSQNSKITDINDEEEYPELGKSFKPSSQKENAEKKENISIGQVKEKVSNVCTGEFKDKEISLIANKNVDVKKVKSDKVVHPSDPITVTFFDILMTRNPKAKVKDIKDDVNIPAQSNYGLSKHILKKNVCLAPNLLDSSKPATKRGKERENPKPKKPSHLKKIILLDRKLRREQLLKLRINSVQGGNNIVLGNESETQQNLNDVHGIGVDAGDVDEESISEIICDLDYSEVSLNVFDEENDTTLFQSSDTISSEGIQNTPSSEATVSILVNDDSADRKGQNCVCKIPTDTAHSEKHLNVLESNDSLLKSLSGDAKSFQVSEKEKAAKILLHTRNFREYCNHLVSKDIDDAVHALLDDLARFQDRMHQKDPVKARIKRRMIYGVKEVKKHIKIKKLKCIIIATDIENVETEGGLNDILNDIKSLAADHNIPCAFALSRKALGKVCRKPVSVSCIGVFNFEGSEVNFKKIVELLTVSKKDYADILNNLTMKITEEEAVALFRAKKEAPETLHDIRSNILRDYFLPTKGADAEQLKALGQVKQNTFD